MGLTLLGRCSWLSLRFYLFLFVLLAKQPVSRAQQSETPAHALATRAPDLSELILWEQTVNEKIENTDEFATIKKIRLPEAYRPESQKVFPLWTVEVPEERIQLFQTGPTPEDRVFVKRNGKRFVKFYVHPKSEKLFRKYLPDAKWSSGLDAAATSSYRSLLAWDRKNPLERPFGVKVSLDAEIGQVWRVLKKDQIETSAAMSAWLNSVDRKTWEKRGALFMDEPVNAFLKGPDLGFSFREYPHPPKGRHLVPLFSYYSKRANNKEPLIVEALRNSGEDARSWVDKNIIEPQTRHYTRMLIEEGVAGVPHEQNVLVEVASKGEPTGRFMYRDLGGFSIDAEMRSAAKKNLSFVPQEVSLDSILLKGDSLEGARTYLIDSNFYAMRKSLEKHFPEITEKWILERFREHIRANAPELRIKKGAKERDLTVAFKVRAKKSNCEKMFAEWKDPGAQL